MLTIVLQFFTFTSYLFSHRTKRNFKRKEKEEIRQKGIGEKGTWKRSKAGRKGKSKKKYSARARRTRKICLTLPNKTPPKTHKKLRISHFFAIDVFRESSSGTVP
jgi:hypothetical protein